MEGGSMNIDLLLAETPIDSIGVSTAIRPGRNRTRAKEKVDGKKPEPADKKMPASRKAPSRGRYVDEYARPPGV